VASGDWRTGCRRLLQDYTAEMSSTSSFSSVGGAVAADDLVLADHDHLWHPFTPMRQWRGQTPLIIERGEGCELIDTQGRRYIDGVSSLWCNVHGHRVAALDQAVREQLDRIAHTTLLGLSSPPAIQLAAALVQRLARPHQQAIAAGQVQPLNKVFYSDAGATALEVAFKMAAGYWHHLGQPQRTRFVGLAGAYHGDTTGAMSVGFSELFHKPFHAMVFDVESFPSPDPCRVPDTWRADLPPLAPDRWPSEQTAYHQAVGEQCLAALAALLEDHGEQIAAVVVEPVMQGAAGMIAQPPGFLADLAALARRHGTLLIADEVATGFGRTGHMLACDSEDVVPDILCLAKGITGGYLPLAATLTTDAIARAFEGDDDTFRQRTFYHGHTYTGNPLACAAALASLALFEQPVGHAPDLLSHIRASAGIITQRLSVLADHPNILDVRQRGLMVGIELCRDRRTATSFDFSRRQAATLCQQMRGDGLIIRPLGDVMVLMPIPAMDHAMLEAMLDVVVGHLSAWRYQD